MPHAIWNGSISFGLVTIPVTIFPAEDRSSQLAFHMLDKRDLSPIKQKRINSSSGEEVNWDDIVKGYELEEGRWVVLTDEDFTAANVEATQTIDIISAVCADEVDPAYYDKPYVLEPAAAGRKAYALLREVLSQAGRIALVKVVIRKRQRLAALIPREDALMLELLRYPYDLRSTEEYDLPSMNLADTQVTSGEIDMAKQLLQAIERPFDPGAEEYRDTYRDDLFALIERKAQGESVWVEAKPEQDSSAEVVDIVELLKRSLDEAKRAQG